ncbi:hypothetical protein CBF93_09645 [Limosilactobacillus reuteri]|uniref:hypothetical protein n=1 Tax=Limosilactobacillus reuteri TaxID=1598 RepID=UPI000B9818E7|nr:hypothetical protein [Limosilactobacillus reuteri]OYS57351.1 hypothetical protein CBF93_09645 [Limosilactobacillus reuteri]
MDSNTIQKLNNLEDTIEQAKLESLGTKGLVSLLDDTLEKIYCDEDLEEKKLFSAFRKSNSFFSLWTSHRASKITCYFVSTISLN